MCMAYGRSSEAQKVAASVLLPTDSQHQWRRSMRNMTQHEVIPSRQQAAPTCPSVLQPSVFHTCSLCDAQLLWRCTHPQAWVQCAASPKVGEEREKVWFTQNGKREFPGQVPPV